MQYDEAYFRTMYGDYEARNPDRKLAFYRKLLLRHAPNREHRRILDLGCAYGLFLASLGGQWRKTGVDLSEHALGHAKHKIPDGAFAMADCTEPPLQGQFDAIVSFDMLEHIQDVHLTREFVRRSLSTDGVFVFVVPVYDGILGPVITALDKDPTHVHKRSREWWLAWARESFDVVEWTGILRYGLPGWYLHVPAKAIRSFATAIAVVARLKH